MAGGDDSSGRWLVVVQWLVVKSTQKIMMKLCEVDQLCVACPSEVTGAMGRNIKSR